MLFLCPAAPHYSCPETDCGSALDAYLSLLSDPDQKIDIAICISVCVDPNGSQSGGSRHSNRSFALFVSTWKELHVAQNLPSFVGS